MPTKIDLLDNEIQAYVLRNDSDPLLFNSFSCMSADVPESQRKKIAFVLQNTPTKIEQLLGKEGWIRIVNGLKKKYKVIVERDGGGFGKYNVAMIVLHDETKCRDEAREWETGKNIPNDVKTLVCKGDEVEVKVFFPLQHAYTRYEKDVKAHAETRAIHKTRAAECQKTKRKKECSLVTLSNARRQHIAWYQSIEQGATSQIGALMHENSPAEHTTVLSAYLVSLTDDQQMVSMDLNSMLNGQNFWPDLQDLHRYESSRETKWRLDYLRRRKENNGAKMTMKSKNRLRTTLRYYKEARLRTALKFVEHWCNPENEFAKVLLKQLKSRVKEVNDKKEANYAKARARRKAKSEKTRKFVCVEGEFSLHGLFEAGKNIFDQQVKS